MNQIPKTPPIRKAEFVRAITRPEQAPEARPSVIFAGRSNVGKSSLLNVLVGRRGLARTSSTPGRTREIHYYNIEDAAWFIDLPGYGYAKVSKAQQASWGPMMRRFLQRAAEIRLVVVILDARRDPSEGDRQLLEWLAADERPYIFAVTKIDKLSRSECGVRLKALQRTLGLADDSALVPVSAKTRAGVDDLLGVIRAALAPS